MVASAGMTRGGTKTSAVLWIGWFALAAWLTWAGSARELALAESIAPHFAAHKLSLFIGSVLAFAFYHRYRRAWVQWEPLIAALPAIAGLVYEPRATVAVIAIVLATLALGRQLCALIELQPQGPVEEIAIAAALGFGALHCALFVLAVAGLYSAWILAALFAAMLAICIRQLQGLWAAAIAIKRTWAKEVDLLSLPGSLLVVFGGALAVTGSIVILTPPLAFDVVSKHLPLVHYYASQHALRTPSYLSYGYFPQSIELLMTAGFLFGADAAAQMLPPVFFALTSMTAYRVGRMAGFDRFASFAGVVFSAAIPFLHWTGVVAKNDLALAFFVLTALLGYLRWRESRDFRWIEAAAFFLAMAAGVKHVVVFAVPPLLLFFTQAALRQRAPLRSLATVAGILIVFGLFWHARAAALTGNPIFPQTASAANKIFIGHDGSVWQSAILPYLRFPWEIFFRGRIYFESALDQPLGIMLVLFAPLWLLAGARINPAEAACLLFCGLYFAYWALTAEMIRYAIPPFILLTVLTAGRLILFWRAAPAAPRYAAIVAAAYALLFGFFGIAIQELNIAQLRYLGFRIDKTEYLRESLGPYRALEFVNAASRPGDRVLGVEACSLLYVSDPAMLDCAVERESGPSEIQAKVSEKPYRFLIVPANRPELKPADWSRAYGDELYDVFSPARGH